MRERLIQEVIARYDAPMVDRQRMNLPLDEVPLGLWRDATYLGWRYRDWPDVDYRVALARRGGQLVGAVVYSLGWFGHPIVPLVDWIGPGGDDEALALFGTTDGTALSGSIRSQDHHVLVLKRGPGPASVFSADGEVSEPALAVEVVETTGAGDAFAAGYLAATVFGWPIRARLRLGHVMASRTVSVVDHVPPPLSQSELDMLAPAALDARWSASAPRTDGPS